MLKVVEYSECFYFMAVLVQDYIANGEMEYGEREMIMFKQMWYSELEIVHDMVSENNGGSQRAKIHRL